MANLTVNLNKGEFCQAFVDYLGHTVGQGQVKPIMAKVDAINNFPTPTYQHQTLLETKQHQLLHHLHQQQV
jgi:hypothetical protein